MKAVTFFFIVLISLKTVLSASPHPESAKDEGVVDLDNGNNGRNGTTVILRAIYPVPDGDELNWNIWATGASIKIKRVFVDLRDFWHEDASDVELFIQHRGIEVLLASVKKTAEPVFYGNPEKREGFDYTFSDGKFTLTPRSNKAVNLALNRPARQSTTLGECAASFAVDGNIFGTVESLTVARTHSTSYLHGKGDPEPWWQVNLGSKRSVGTVVLWDSETEPIKRQLAVQEITVMFDDGRGYADASVVGADTNSSFTLTYVPALSVFNPDHPMYCKTYDCHNVCNGKAVLDACGVCGGDESSCRGCRDKNACTYAINATVHDQSLCVYSLAHHNCFGDCTRTRDCGGGCGGAPSTKLGRYVFIRNLRRGQQLNLNEVVAYDHHGRILQAQAATLSSTMTPAFVASNCIEVRAGRADTAMCHAARNDANPWLRVDYGKPVDIRRLVVTNRVENNCCRDRIVGATISVATDAAGTDVIWIENFRAEQHVYVWTHVGLRPLLTRDACGVCNGDNSTCTGCMDKKGCNFEPEAKVPGTCTYPQDNHTCHEHCTTFTDCAGNCGGFLRKDACGVCGGDNSTCTGCMDEKSCNYDAEATIAGPCSHSKTEMRDCQGKCVKVTYVKVEGSSCAARGYADLLDMKECRDTVAKFSVKGVIDTAPSNRTGSKKLIHGCYYLAKSSTLKWLGKANASEPESKNGDLDAGDLGFCRHVGVDCFGNCGGINTTDRCGVCGGDGTSCQGCLDANACNFDYRALLPGGTPCTYPKRNHWCNGLCKGAYDCRGECLGTANVDLCGVCEGDGSSCRGCQDPTACNYQPDAARGPLRRSGDTLHNMCIYKDTYPGFGSDCYGAPICNGGNGKECTGCKDKAACNYNETATTHDKSLCQYHHSYFGTMKALGREMQRGPANMYDCDGKCKSVLDCSGMCGGTKVKDACGVCGGDGSSCTACMDRAACNFDFQAVVHNQSMCTYPVDNLHDCHGICVAGYNCHGECQRYQFAPGCPEEISQHLRLRPFEMINQFKCKLVVETPVPYDACGVCGGDNSSCTGCMDPHACNYNALNRVDGGDCTYPPANDWLWTRIGSGRCADASGVKFGYYQYGDIKTVEECKAICESYYLCVGVTYGSNSCHVLISKGGFESAVEPPPQKKEPATTTRAPMWVPILFGHGASNLRNNGAPMHMRLRKSFHKPESPVAPAAVTDYKGEGRVAQAVSVAGYTCYSISRAPVEVVVGGSGSHFVSSKTVHVERDGLVCPPVVDRYNWVSSSRSAATFAISVQGTAVTVNRTDKPIGWIMNLRLPCSYSAEERYLMRDACGPRDVKDYYQPAWATGYVTCCEMDGSAAERNSQRLGGACSDLKTFAQAKAFCAAGGMRLCKPSELSEGCGQGCGYDSVAVWTTGLERNPLPSGYNCAAKCISPKGVDCNGVCGSGVTEDACGVCGGDNSTCWGCKDPKACNYNSKAIVDSKRCVYHYDNNPNYDCDFKCIAPRDCAGVCAGTAKVDACGVCKGDGQSCTTCTDEKACNYEPSNHSDPNLCHYPPDNIHNCHGVCTKGVDCAGTCNGAAVPDRCGVCGGDNSACVGCPATSRQRDGWIKWSEECVFHVRVPINAAAFDGVGSPRVGSEAQFSMQRILQTIPGLVDVKVTREDVTSVRPHSSRVLWHGYRWRVTFTNPTDVTQLRASPPDCYIQGINATAAVNTIEVGEIDRVPFEPTGQVIGGWVMLFQSPPPTVGGLAAARKASVWERRIMHGTFRELKLVLDATSGGTVQAQYLRVQLEEPAHLTLAEVQVFAESARVVSTHDEGLPMLPAAHSSLHQGKDRLHYVSAESLSAVFVGKPLQGAWTLRIKDKRAAARKDTDAITSPFRRDGSGALNDWTLRVEDTYGVTHSFVSGSRIALETVPACGKAYAVLSDGTVGPEIKAWSGHQYHMNTCELTNREEVPAAPSQWLDAGSGHRILYVPLKGFSGTDHITFRAILDGQVSTVPGQFTFHVRKCRAACDQEYSDDFWAAKVKVMDAEVELKTKLVLVKVHEDGELIPLDAKPSDTVAALKTRIRLVRGIPEDRQRLMMYGTEIDDAKKIGDYDKNMYPTLTVILQVKGPTHSHTFNNGPITHTHTDHYEHLF